MLPNKNYDAILKSIVDELNQLDVNESKMIDYDKLACKLFAVWAEIDINDIPSPSSSDGIRLREGFRPSNGKYFTNFLQHCPTGIQDIIRKCWETDANQRPTPNQIKTAIVRHFFEYAAQQNELDVLIDLTKKYGAPFFLRVTHPTIYIQLLKSRANDPALKKIFDDYFAKSSALAAENRKQDEDLYQTVSSDIKKNYTHLIQSSVEAKKTINLPENFLQKDQGRFNEFWKNTIPLLAQQFLTIAKDMEPPAQGLSQILYQLVADQRRAIAAELGQKHPLINFSYGLFRPETWEFDDLLLERDITWGSYYEPTRRLLKKYPNEELDIYEKMIDYEGKISDVLLGSIKKIEAGKQSLKMLKDPYILKYKDQNGIWLSATHGIYQDYLYKRLDGLVKEVLDLKVDKDNTDNLFFLLGSIMWYLGHFVPLQAGSANTTESFINALLVAKQFSPEKFVLYEGVPWFFYCKCVSRAEFVKVFAAFFEKTPQFVPKLKENLTRDDQSPKFKMFDKTKDETSDEKDKHTVDAKTSSNLDSKSSS